MGGRKAIHVSIATRPDIPDYDGGRTRDDKHEYTVQWKGKGYQSNSHPDDMLEAQCSTPQGRRRRNMMFTAQVFGIACGTFRCVCATV